MTCTLCSAKVAPVVDDGIRLLHALDFYISTNLQHLEYVWNLCRRFLVCMLNDVQVELTQAQGGHDSSVQCITVDQQYLYSADWHGNIKVRCLATHLH